MFTKYFSKSDLSIRTKITVLFASVVIGFLFISFCIQLHITEKSLQNAIYESAINLARASANAIERFLADCSTHTRVIAQAIPAEAILAQDTAAAQTALKRMAEMYPVFENGLFLLNNEGILWADYPPHPETYGKSLVHRDYYQRSILKNQGVIGQPYRSLRTGEPVLTFTEILRNAAGERIGLIGCSTQLNSDLALGGIQNQKFGKTGYIYVYDKSRLMILHPDKERLLKRDVPLGSNKLFDAAIHGFEGVGETTNSRSIPMLLALVQLPSIDWIVGVQQPRSEVFASLNHTRFSALILLVFGALVAGGAGILSIRHLTSPLAFLQEAAQRLEKASGNPAAVRLHSKQQHRSKLLSIARSADEVGQLAKAFSSMDAKLSETLQTLSQAVSEWQITFDAVNDALFVVDSSQRVLRMNKAATALLGTEFKKALNEPLPTLLFGGDSSARERRLDHLLKEGGPATMATSELVVKGDFEISGVRVETDEDWGVGGVFVLRDVTQRNQLEMHLRQAHKTEALGTLAGGIAHDFNNVLSAVLGSAELARLKLEDQPDLHRLADEIIKAGERGAELVKSLMSYCRQEVPEKRVIAVNELLADMQAMLRRLLGRQIELSLKLGAGPMHVLGSKAQIEQVIMNLVINARDAMPQGGRIVIETAGLGTSRPEKETAATAMSIKVSDTGVGMTPEAVSKIFDPFFTTKPEGEGTGLGLSIVHGIIQAHGGRISAESSPGRGTVFSILLPLIAADEPAKIVAGY